ncbi:MAG: hypothetical protein WC464_00130 [Bdellovibrionales bacterium]|jgi:hypothetical protein
MTREEYAIEIKKCSYANDKLDVCIEYIKSLEQQNAELQARIKELEEKPKCCQFHQDNISRCEGCDWIDECIHHKSYTSKQNNVH